MDKKLKNAVKVLTDALKVDEAYWKSWQANIAMAYKDNEYQYKKETGKSRLNREDTHIVANRAADYFLNLLCTTQGVI